MITRSEIKRITELNNLVDELALNGLAARLERIEARLKKLEKARVDNIDYDLFVIDPTNEDTTPQQLRDCIYDALTILDKRTKNE
jgi:hypothetical protein|nr:MAG TPA: YnzC [Caudoviricetes sp.]